MVGADRHPAGISGEIIDPVRHRLARAVPGEVMRAGSHRLALGPPFPACVLELADQLFLLGVHADHRVRGALVGLDLLVDVPELRVPVRVPLALDGLGVALQAEPPGPQQVANGVGADPVALAGQLGRQVTGGLGGSPQRRHRITPLVRLHQGQQRRAQPRIRISRPPAAPQPEPGRGERGAAHPRAGVGAILPAGTTRGTRPGSPRGSCCSAGRPAWSKAPPPPPLQALISSVAAGCGLHLYIPN